LFAGAVGFLLAVESRAQAPGPESTAPPSGPAAAKGDGPGARAAAGAAKKQAKAPKAPDEDYGESIRKTVERRRQRRARRGQGMMGSAPIGGIVPWPMPPALVIRHTRETHEEIESFLGLIGK
jgi:hypothetical protein